MFRNTQVLVLWLMPLSAVLAQTGDEQDQTVADIFRRKCTVCHDNRPGDSGGDVEHLLDFVALSDPRNGYIDKVPADSYLTSLIQNGDMPRQDWKDDLKWSGPLTTDEKTSVLQWIERGGPSDLYRRQAASLRMARQRKVLSERESVELIANDLLTLKGTRLKNARYLTLTNLHNRNSVSSSDLELYRQGMVKMLNSLSSSSDVLGMPDSDAVNKVVSVDSDATIYRFDLRHIGWTAADWERVVRHYPYGLIHADGFGQSVYTLTDSKFPLIRADWFVFATSQAPLYHDLLGINDKLPDLEQKLGIDRLENIRQFQVARAAFGNSRVSVNNRMVERHSFRGGYYHISYDCFRNDGPANFFNFPLGPKGAFDTEFAFEHDGGEVIFTLPNGFQAYVLVTATGQRLSIAPSAVVHDDSMPAGAILNGISCISCHYNGMKPENPRQLSNLDELRELAAENTRRFTPADRRMIEELYPPHEEFRQLIESDRTAWTQANQQAGLSKNGPGEPVRALFDAFVRNLDLDVAAAEFGIDTDDFEQLLNREGETRLLAQRLKKQGIQRQLYIAEFRRIAELSGLGEPREFEALNVPYFGHDPDSQPNAAPSASQIDLLTGNNQPVTMTVTVGDIDDRKAFDDGETIPCRIKANQDCFVTILGIDPLGEVSCLLPNRWHHETDGKQWWSGVKLKANHTTEISVQNFNFELVAQPPHGPTRIRVIVTRGEPLKMKFDKNIAGQLQGKGIPVLGFALQKGIGVRPGNQEPDPARVPVPVDLTERPLAELFGPNDWATAEWTFMTKPER